jgi:hypothetical protein
VIFSLLVVILVGFSFGVVVLGCWVVTDWLMVFITRKEKEYSQSSTDLYFILFSYSLSHSLSPKHFTNPLFSSGIRSTRETDSVQPDLQDYTNLVDIVMTIPFYKVR